MDRELISQAIEGLQIQDVFLRKSTARLADDFSPFVPDAELDPAVFHKFMVTGHKTFTADVDGKPVKIIEFDYDAGAKLVGKDKADDEDVEGIVVIEATFSAAYLLMEGEVSTEALKEFGRYNVGFNIWPYWRELLSSTLTRFHLPPITLPFYSTDFVDKLNQDG